jgi:hypothetical protein
MTRRLYMLITVTMVLSLPACDTLGDLYGGEDASLSADALTGKVLAFTPDTPAGGVNRWEYRFDSGSVTGCNVEATYTSTGWSVVDDQTVRVNFGTQWEEYSLVDAAGTLEEGSLSGRFELDTSPGISMAGSFVQQSSTIYC